MEVWKPNFVNQLWRSLSCFFFMIKCLRIVRNNLKFKTPQDPDWKTFFFQLFVIRVATGSFDPYCRIFDPLLEVEDDLQHMPHVPHVPHSPLAGQVCKAHVTSFGVYFEPRFFLYARFFVIYFFGYIILFFGSQKYLLNNYYSFMWFN